jgi:penicillin-binding protein 1A
VASGLSSKAGAEADPAGAVVRLVQNAKGDWRVTQQPEVEGALVALDPRTGAIRALVGGFDYGKNKFNHVTAGLRQPGSSFKPFVYSAALERGFTPPPWSTMRRCSSTPAETGSQPWEPKNYDGKFDGPMPLHDGAGEVEEHGLDPHAAVDRAGLRAGLDHALRLRADKHPAYLTMALGAGTVTPLQMASAYGVFATGGYLLQRRR